MLNRRDLLPTDLLQLRMNNLSVPNHYIPIVHLNIPPRPFKVQNNLQHLRLWLVHRPEHLQRIPRRVSRHIFINFLHYKLLKRIFQILCLMDWFLISDFLLIFVDVFAVVPLPFPFFLIVSVFFGRVYAAITALVEVAVFVVEVAAFVVEVTSSVAVVR